MQTVLRLISYLGLGLSLIPAILVFTGTMPLSTYYKFMIAGMILWFGSAIFWIKPEKTEG